MLKIDHHPGHGRLQTVQADADILHALGIDRDPALPRLGNGVGED